MGTAGCVVRIWLFAVVVVVHTNDPSSLNARMAVMIPIPSYPHPHGPRLVA